MALHTELEIYRSAFDLAGAAVDVVLQMRRDVKPVLGKLMVDECFGIVLNIRAANMAQDEEKEPHLLQLLERLTNVETAVRLCRDRHFIARPAYSRIVEHTQSVGRQANAWRKHYTSGVPQRQLPGC